MRDMTRDEMISFIKSWTWGTLIGVEGEKPYAVEVSYGTDDEYLYCGSMPGGEMAKCIAANQNVVFKICDTDKSCNKWHAVSVRGKAEKLTDYDDVLHALRAIASGMGMPDGAFDGMAEKVTNNPDSNSLRIPLNDLTGKTIGY
jgi:nitroimidazol reductase NimA-like FMN-containing flavoprotein (pyridoxamine 5'-phosphate oxidase superfamily)